MKTSIQLRNDFIALEFKYEDILLLTLFLGTSKSDQYHHSFISSATPYGQMVVHFIIVVIDYSQIQAGQCPRFLDWRAFPVGMASRVAHVYYTGYMINRNKIV